MADPLPRGDTPNQQGASAAGDRLGAQVIEMGRDGVNAVRNGVSGAWNYVTGNGTPAAASGTPAAGNDGAAASGSDDNEDTDPNTPGVQRRRSSFRWGDMVGGLLGVGGAWLASSIFGGGWLGTIMFALFAIPAFMMGRGQLGNWISGMLGEQPRPTPAQGQTPAAGVAAGQAQDQTATPGQPAAGVAAAPAAPQLTPQQQLQQEVAEVAQKSQIARASIAHLVQTGEMNPRRAQTAMRNIGRAEQMVQQMQTLDVNQLSEGQLQRIMREFNQAETYLDRTIGQNPILAAQIQQQVAPVQPVAPQPAAPQPGAQWYQPAGAVPMGRPVTAIGSVLDPQAQAQVNAMRNQGYTYAPATEVPSAGPRFDASTYGMYQYPGSQRVN